MGENTIGNRNVKRRRKMERKMLEHLPPHMWGIRHKWHRKMVRK